MSQIEKLPLTSLNIQESQIEKLKELFPEVFTEGSKIDWDRLKLTLGENVDTGKERFGMNWPGKADCFKTIQQPSIATLVPDRNKSLDFDDTQNIFIEGDNLEVLKLLQKSYLGKIKMIYIDPPYNTGGDFIYPDNYAENLSTYLEYTGQVDSEGKKFSTNTETDGRFHSKWMNMMYPRLFLAKNLLTDDGVIFISIDDGELDNLLKIGNEIFGEECFVATFPWRKRTAKSDVPFGVSQDYEWVVAYTKDRFGAGIDIERKYYQTEDFATDRWRLSDLTTQRSEEERPNSAFELIDPKTNKKYPHNPKRVWGISKDTFQSYYDKGKIVFPDDYDFLNISIPAYRVFESEDKAKALKKYGSEDAKKAVSTFLPKEVGMSEDGNKEIVELFGQKVFSFPKPSSLIKHFLKTINESDFTVLDFFAGSSSTAHAVLGLNVEDAGTRKFICVQLPEPVEIKSEASKAGFKTISDISIERISRVIQEFKTKSAKNNDMFKANLDKLDLGFKVFKLKESNFKIWDALLEKNQDVVQTALDLHVNHLSATAQQENILYEILLKSGFDLTTSIEKIDVEGKTIYSIASGELLICLEKNLTNDLIKIIAEKQPTRAICLDEGFQNNDQLKTNAVQIMKSKSVVSFRTV